MNNEITLHTIAMYDDKEYELQDLLNNLLNELQRKDNIINELKWKKIEEYDEGNYDWVLVKYFDGDYECVPDVAEKRHGKWYDHSDKEIIFDVKYFADMQVLDKIKELENDN